MDAFQTSHCSKCNLDKPKEEFAIQLKNKSGLNSWCRKCKAEGMKEHYWRNPQKRRERSRVWGQIHKELISKLTKERYIKNPDFYREKAKKKRSTIKGKLSNNMTWFLWRALKGKKDRRKWEAIVGYTAEELKRHLESRFTSGMSWENYGFYGWHIDHVIPKSHFHYEATSDAQFKACWSLSNLQPLWAKDNLSKHDKVLA